MRSFTKVLWIKVTKMDYFSKFPYITYNFNSSSKAVTAVRNILFRSNFLKSVIDLSSSYYEYDVKDTDTAEIIAEKYYGDSTRYWLVLLYNQYLDPYFSFPLKSNIFDDYIIQNYGSIVNAQTTLHHVSEITNKKLFYNGELINEETTTNIVSGDVTQTYNYATDSLVPSNFPQSPIDPDYVVSADPVLFDDGTILYSTTTYHAVSNYDYELGVNEQKRKIKLLDKIYADVVEKELIGILQNGK